MNATKLAARRARIERVKESVARFDREMTVSLHQLLADASQTTRTLDRRKVSSEDVRRIEKDLDAYLKRETAALLERMEAATAQAAASSTDEAGTRKRGRPRGFFPSPKKRRAAEAVRRVQDICGTKDSIPTMRQYRTRKRPSDPAVETVMKLFSPNSPSWHGVARALEMRPNYAYPRRSRTRPGISGMLHDYRQACKAEGVGRNGSIGTVVFRRYVPYSIGYVRNRWPVWNDFVWEAGYTPQSGKSWLRGADRARLFECSRREAFQEEAFFGCLNYERGSSEKTTESYSHALDAFIHFLGQKGVRHRTDVRREHVQEFQYSLTERRLSPATVRARMAALRSYFDWLYGEELIQHNPTDGIELPKLPWKLPDVLRIDEVEALLDAPREQDRFYLRDRALIEFMYATGARVSEVLAVRVRDLRFEDQQAVVYGKGNKERVVLMGRTATKVVQEYISSQDISGLLFPRPRTKQGVGQVLKKHAKRAGITKHITPHTLRRTFATHLLEGGADLVTIQELLGHADISTTQRYIRAESPYLREQYKKHPRA